MQSFNESLKFFKQQEFDPITDNADNMENRNKKQQNSRIPCVSKDLYTNPPESNFFILQVFYLIVHNIFVVLSRLRLGQKLISVLDYYMVRIEYTVEFCIPGFEFASPEIVERHNRTLPVKARPMCWIFFIPALILLRIIRFWISVISILRGYSEFNADDMQAKVVAFRRYYRSIRHFAVTEYWREDDFKVIDKRKATSFCWRKYYQIYEMIFMMRPIVADHSEPRKMEKYESKRYYINAKGHLPNQHINNNNASQRDSDNQSPQNNNSTSYGVYPQEEYIEMLKVLQKFSTQEHREFEEKKDSSGDEEEEKTESQKNLNETPTSSKKPTIQDLNNKSNDLEMQLSKLENEIFNKLLKHFGEKRDKRDENYNDIYYSPVDSPPEVETARSYNSDPEIHFS